MPRAFIHASFLVTATSLFSQGIYTNSNKPGDPVCPLVQIDKTSLNYGSNTGRQGNTGGQRGADADAIRNYQSGSQSFQPDHRKDVSSFNAYDSKGKAISLASLKGKVVLVGLWSVRCDPSAKMLMEMASLYDKRSKYGFEILPVNFDLNQQDGGGISGGWPAINQFMNRNPQFFKESKMAVFTPGLGKEGASNFMDIVYSLPALFVVDRDGKLASINIGYKDGFVGEALTRVVSERPPVAPAPAPAAAPKP